MKDNKKSYKNRIVRLMSLILLLFPISANNNILAFDKDKDMRIMLMPNRWPGLFGQAESIYN